MAAVPTIIMMCKDGRVQDAYNLAKQDLELETQAPFPHIAMGWAIYYSMKEDVALKDLEALKAHLLEFYELNRLESENDAVLFSCILLALADFVKLNINVNDPDGLAALSSLFHLIKDKKQSPSTGYSKLLRCCIKAENWEELADFISWWRLSSLREEDYEPYVTEDGKRSMALAEMAYIAYAKALLHKNDNDGIMAFLPSLHELMVKYPRMTYPGYFYARLLLASGGNREEAMRALRPFARKKYGEFWIWQLLAEVFQDDKEKSKACLLRAVNCRTKEQFLVKVRLLIAKMYIHEEDYAHGRFHIEKVIGVYQEQGWRLPFDVQAYLHEEWMKSIQPQAVDTMDYKAITDALLFGKKKVEKHAEEKEVHGIVQRREGQDFAFLRFKKESAFISPRIVEQKHLNNGDRVCAKVTWARNEKKDRWEWKCIRVSPSTLETCK